MQLTRFPCFNICILTIVVSFSTLLYADDETYPDVTGTWVNSAVNTSSIVSKYTLMQDGKNLSGIYVDEKNGKEIANSPIIGFIDTQGGVIFDLYFGKVTATNRLKLSSNGKEMEGTFSTTMGNNGNVHLIKSE